MINKQRWVCTICGDDFTRRSSATRHSRNLHAGNGMIVRPFEYIIGRQNGKFPEPADPLTFRKYKNKINYQNSQTGYPFYSHDNYNGTCNAPQYYNNVNTFRIQTQHPVPGPISPVLQQLSSNHEKQSGYSSRQLEKMSKHEKLTEVERLLFKYHDPHSAEAILKVLYTQVFNLGDESGLNHQLKLLLGFEKTMLK